MKKLTGALLLFWLLSCNPVITPAPSFSSIFEIKGTGNTLVIFDVSGANALVGITGSTQVELSHQGGLILELEEELIVSPGTYQTQIQSDGIWVLSLGAASRRDPPTIVINFIIGQDE